MTPGEIPVPETLPAVISVRGARHNNLRDIDVDVPLWRTVAVVGVSGSGKTSLAMGTLYAEGLQRFLEALSTYSRRRLAQAQRPDVDRIEHLPPALALRQRPPVPGPRSTVGTMSEVLNVLRLMMSRLGEHRCPNGHMVQPSIAVEQEEIVCPVCGARFVHPGAESFAFNSYGACPACQGLGVRSEVDESTLVPDPDRTIEDGAVLPWNSGGRRLSMYAAGELGVRLDVPYQDLTDREKDIVLHGEPVKRQVTLHSDRPGRTDQLSVNYDNAVAAVERSLRSDNERTRRLVQRFLITRTCSVCHGTRLRPEALSSRLGGRNLAEISALSLDELRRFTAGLPPGLPAELSRMATGLLTELDGRLTPLLDVGLSYLTLDRAGASLSTGERQRIELTSTVRASTTGMLYVLDEPSVGLHPSNVQGLLKTITALAGNGNSVVVVEHEREVIRAADWIIELGPGAGVTGGTIIAQGTPAQLESDPHSIIGPFLAGAAAVGLGRSDTAAAEGLGKSDTAVPRDRPPQAAKEGEITIEIGDLYNLHDLTAVFPVGRLTALAGPSGAGKTALILDSLIPAAQAWLRGSARPAHVRRLDLGGIRQVVQVLLRAQLGQRVVPLAEPVLQHRGGDPGRAVGTAAALGGLAGVPESRLCFRPAVHVLQGEDAVIQGERPKVRVAGIVAQHAQGPVDVVQRAGVVASDAVAQPEVGQGVGGRERVTRLLGDGEGLPGGLVGRIQLAALGPLEHRQEGQHPGSPGQGQVGQRHGLPHGGARLVAVARTDLGTRQRRVRLGLPQRVSHHRQRRRGLPDRLVIGSDGEQGPDQAGQERIPGLIADGRLIRFLPKQVGGELWRPGGQRGRVPDEPGPGPDRTRRFCRDQLLRDAQGIRVGGGELSRRLIVEHRAQGRRHALIQRLMDQLMPEGQLGTRADQDAGPHCLLQACGQVRHRPAQ